MKLLHLAASVFLLSFFISEATAQNLSASEIEVKNLYDEFNIAFNDADSEKLSSTFLHTPLTLRQDDKVTLVNTEEQATLLMENVFKMIKQKGWVRSESFDIKICEISENIIFIDNEYSRLREDGTAIEPAIRKTLQVWQKINDEWRIVSFYVHDSAISIDCEK